MKHPLITIDSFEISGPFTLSISFSDQKKLKIDFAPILRGELFGPLREPEFFKKVALDPEVKTIVWPNGADFDPAVLYAWDEVKDELYARAQKWAEAPENKSIDGIAS